MSRMQSMTPKKPTKGRQGKNSSLHVTLTNNSVPLLCKILSKSDVTILGETLFTIFASLR